MTMPKIAVIAALATVALLSASPARADLMLKLTDGTNTFTVTDQMAGDVNPTAGVITFIGGVGNWNINVSTGTGSPALDPGHLDLTTTSINSTGSGTLDILLTQTGLTAPDSFTMQFSSTLSGASAPGSTTTFQAWRDATNTAFGLGGTNLLGTIGPFGIGANAGSIPGALTASGTYSLTERIRIVATGATVMSGDAELLPSAVPEPGTLTLLGTGLFGLARATRSRSRKAPVA
jgi:PEP-CTERM motif-containing protein